MKAFFVYLLLFALVHSFAAQKICIPDFDPLVGEDDVDMDALVEETLEVLERLTEGLSPQEIADQLGDIGSKVLMETYVEPLLNGEVIGYSQAAVAFRMALWNNTEIKEAVTEVYTIEPSRALGDFLLFFDDFDTSCFEDIGEFSVSLFAALFSAYDVQILSETLADFTSTISSLIINLAGDRKDQAIKALDDFVYVLSSIEMADTDSNSFLGQVAGDFGEVLDSVNMQIEMQELTIIVEDVVEKLQEIVDLSSDATIQDLVRVVDSSITESTS